MTETALEDRTEAKLIAEVLPPIIDKAMPAERPKKDRSNGNYKNLKPCKAGEVRNPRGNPEHKPYLANVRKVRALYAREGFSADDVAYRMTGWLKMPYGKAIKKMNDDKTHLFERLGISILIHATENGDTSRLNSLLDRIIGPVIQHTSADIRTLSITGKADIDLLARIQGDLKQGKPLELLPDQSDT